MFMLRREGLREEEAEELVRGLAPGEREKLAEELLETLLSSVNADMVPDEVGWKVAEALRARALEKPENLVALVGAVDAAEPEKLRRILGRLGVP